jgi:hypothetical protein
MSRSKDSMEMYKLQESIRNNTNDVNQAVHDLVSWTTGANTKEKTGPAKPAQATSKP